MENNEELVNTTENVEELTTEEIEDVETNEPVEEVEETSEPKEETFTKSQLDEIVKKRLGRQENKLRKEYAKKYGKLETVVNAGLGTEDIDEAVNKLTDFYKTKGINIPTEPQYSTEDLEVLASKDAEDIISGGYEDIVEEVDRLAQINPDNMSARERITFTKLANARKEIEEEKELASIGVKKEELEAEEFKTYAAKLNPNLTLKEKYDMYLEQKPKKEIKTIGSMKGIPESKYKDYYTPEEISKLTEEDLDDPRIWEAVRRSMTGRN